MLPKSFDQADSSILDGLKLAETIRNLDATTAMRVALTLAGNDPQLFLKYIETTKPSRSIPVSTLKLVPVPSHINGEK